MLSDRRVTQPLDVCYIILCHLLVCDLNRTPIVMAKHGGSCVHFSGISTCGRTSPETVSHPQRQPLPTACKISLPVYVIVTNKRLQLLQQPCIIHWCYLFRCWKFYDVWLNIGVFCAPCVVAEGSALSFADGAAVVCSTSPMASLIRSMKHPLDVVRVGSWNSLGLQKYYKFKFKYFIVAYTWQGVQLSVTHSRKLDWTQHKKKLYQH